MIFVERPTKCVSVAQDLFKGSIGIPLKSGGQPINLASQES